MYVTKLNVIYDHFIRDKSSLHYFKAPRIFLFHIFFIFNDSILRHAIDLAKSWNRYRTGTSLWFMPRTYIDWSNRQDREGICDSLIIPKVIIRKLSFISQTSIWLKMSQNLLFFITHEWLIVRNKLFMSGLLLMIRIDWADGNYKNEKQKWIEELFY